ncbi:hypothetical protein GCM10018793_56900 [Streptomyces sulfonofaciens]|uniref:Fibronectin type-III domain-containing protein n=1 Tax=Streptomyces sulfonofaciens TaxID=68272 RepID=A0A919GJU2_9ACTN|nr:LamG-like jellyroll fold domain-containing protein [Streptomyces sulfonofaciens]GHH86135.1 hypothetical protein GCM10018793_56900 [Streptomyces sulfonofaciens]
MFRSRGLSAALVLSFAATCLGVVTVPEAAALTPPVAFTADDLPTWQTNGIVWALAHAGDTVFAGGTFSQVRPPQGADGTPRDAVNFVAMNAATGAPTSCDLSFTVGSGTATVRALAVSSDQKTLYAGGYFGSVNGTPVSSLAAIDIATCTPRADFHAAFPATVRALAVTDDTVYAGGDFTTVDGQPRQRFAAVDAASGDVRPFRADADEPGRAVKVTADGKDVVLGGDFFTVNRADSHALAVVDATTGANVKTYPLGFITTTSVVKTIDTDGTGFYTGNEGTGGGVFDGRIAVDAGTFEQRWRDTCLGATQSVLSYEGVLYSASHAHDCSTMGEFPDGRRHHLMAEPTDDPSLLGWFPDTNDGLGEGIGPRALTIAGTGDTHYMWVGGEFTTVNGASAQGLTRFASDHDTGAPGVPQAAAASVTPDRVQVRWRSSTDLDDSKLTYKVYRNGASAPVGTVEGSSAEWTRPQLSFSDTDVTPGQTYTYRVTATDGAGNTSAPSPAATVTVPTSAEKYPQAVLDDGATLYWRYDESTTPFAGDSSPADDAGAYVGGPALRQTPAAVNGPSTALGLDGSDQQVYSDRATTVPGAFSVETWFKTTTGRGGKLIGFGSGTTGTSTYYDKHVYMDNAGKLVFGVHADSSRTLTTAARYNDGKWHHVVGTQSSSGMALYVDGKLAGSNKITGNQSYTGHWHVGGDTLRNWPDAPSSSFFNGQIDETAVYPKALTAGQVWAHYELASAPADTVRTVTATEDGYVNAGAPGTNYGSSGSLAVRGSSAYVSYLRFALPSAPSGTVLKSARLAVKTSTQSGAESADTVSVLPVTGAWTESGVTYTGRPALGDRPIGTLDGTAEGSAVYSAALDTAALSAGLGGSYDMALTGSGSDALWLWSREASAAEGTPQLVLTFGAP